MAFKFLVQKNYLKLGKIVKSENLSERRKNVVCSELDRKKEMKSQYQERASMRSMVKSNSATEHKEPELEHRYKQFRVFSEDVGVTEELQWFDEQKTAAEQKDCRMWDYRQTKEHYEDIAEQIKSRHGGQLKTILMGAEISNVIPVTVPVNIAIQLAKNGHKCLLIDLDYERDSIARVFELHKHIIDETIPSKQTITGIPTCIQNLRLYPALWLTDSTAKIPMLDASKINQIITNLKTRYDYLIMYSPDLNKHNGCKLIGECIDAAMLFGKDSGLLSETFELLEKFECEIIKPQQICVKVS
jgi:Mrp family chromosome partitioning ATPase